MATRIKEPFSVINRRINRAIAQESNKRISKNTRKARNKIKSLVRAWILEQPEIESLLSYGEPGSLNAAFGLSGNEPDTAIEAIASAVSAGVFVTFTKLDQNLRGGVQFAIHPSIISTLLRLDEGFVITEKGTPLHWLDWLLTKGDEIIIVGYRYKPEDGKGRSGGGVMGKGGLSFSVSRVNPAFSGTVDDNFVTRAMLGRDRELTAILAELLEVNPSIAQPRDASGRFK